MNKVNLLKLDARNNSQEIVLLMWTVELNDCLEFVLSFCIIIDTLGVYGCSFKPHEPKRQIQHVTEFVWYNQKMEQ